MSYIIRIPEPCSEDWDKMTPTEKGKYCAVCEREIYDLTHLTNRQLANRIKRNENICGLFRKDQLDTDLYADSDLPLKKYGMAMSIAVMVTVSQSGFAQNNNKQNVEVVDSIQKKETVKVKDTLQRIVTITGKITEKPISNDSIQIEPLPGVNVVIKGTDFKTFTDFDGLFSLKFNLNEVTLPVYLEVSYIGYKTKQIEIKDLNEVSNKAQNIVLQIDEEMEVSEGVLGVIVCKKRNIFQRTGDWFRRLFRKKD